MYKVFIDSLAVYFLKNKQEIKNVFVKKRINIKVNNEAVKTIFEEIEKSASLQEQKVFFICDDLDKVWELFKHKYEFRVAAGGLVMNDKSKVLLIYKNEHWDLPKGHLKQNESPEIGAVREVEEESGISDPQIVSSLTITYHTYVYQGKHILKQNHWFLMKYEKNETLVPQENEGIQKVEWKSKKEYIKCIESSYGSIKDVFTTFTEDNNSELL
jgi:ADP-ribose pyrophosphatase YjhB (NUDIX family)